MSHLLREDAWKVKPRKTAWMRDEVIVALDLYFREGKNPHMNSCAEVSSILRSIPIEEENLSDPKFRSPKSVATKMQNFVSLDIKSRRLVIRMSVRWTAMSGKSSPAISLG
jgi:hypothetical protein